MAVGVPGTGVGGIFYVLLALGMPFRYLARRVRGHARSGEGRAVLLQLALVAGIVGATWAAGLAVTAVLASFTSVGSDAVTAVDAMGATAGATTMRATLLTSLISLAGVLLVVQALRLALRQRPNVPRAPIADRGLTPHVEPVAVQVLPNRR